MGMSGSGKTALALGLALKLREEGFRVSYFKPTGAPPIPARHRGESAVLMREVLNMNQCLEDITPLTAGPLYLSSLHQVADRLERVKEAFNQVASEADVVLVGGSAAPFITMAIGTDDITLAKEFGSGVVFTSQIENDYSLDQTLAFNQLLAARGVEVLGTVFNLVPRQLLSKAEGIYRPVMEGMGYRVLGIVPERPEVTSPTVGEIGEALGAEVLVGGDGMGRVVEDLVIGAMTLESALRYFRRAPNKAVITGGDRSDIAMAALETNTSVLILTGGLYPDVSVLTRAEEKGVPVFLVYQDTYSTIEQLRDVRRRIHPGDEAAINMAKREVEEHLDWRAIVNWVGGK